MYPEEYLALLEIDVSPDWTDAYKADPALLELCYQPDGQLKADWRQSWHGGRLWIGDRILVPASEYDAVITQFHQPLVAGHWGIPRVNDTSLCTVYVTLFYNTCTPVLAASLLR